eukprot:gene11139-3961_t
MNNKLYLKLKEKEKENEKEGITIILNDYSSKLISNFLKEPNVKEIIIFNNNIKKRIKNIESNKIIIFNSPLNLKDYGIKIGCSLSKYKYCYYQSIHWKNNYFKTSFKLFLKNKKKTLGSLDKIYYFEYLKFGFLKKFKQFGIFFSKKNLNLNNYSPLIIPLFHLKEGKYYDYKLKIKNWRIKRLKINNLKEIETSCKIDNQCLIKSNNLNNLNNFMNWNKYNMLNLMDNNKKSVIIF